MFFSILIAHYNNAHYLAAAIKSVRDQTFTDWELIITDDGSTDNFEALVLTFTPDSRIKIYRNGVNRGAAYTKAKCFKLATGVLAGYLDSDDILHPDALRIMVAAHAQMPDCSIVHSTHYICDNKLNIERLAEYPKALPPGTPYLLVGDGSIHHFVSFKCDCLRRSEGLTPLPVYNRASDQELYYLLEEQGSVYFINQPLYYYRIHQGSISNHGQAARAQIEHYKIIEKACLRRIKKLRNQQLAGKAEWTQKYLTRYHKVHLIRCFRERKWLGFFYSGAIFPFVGGLENIVSFIKKLPHGGTLLIKNSLHGPHGMQEKISHK